MQLDPRTLFSTVEFIAVFAFALSGLVEAQRRGLDVVGAFVVAFLTAFGGGTLRDILLDQRPFYWVSHGWLLWGILLMTLIAPPLLRLLSRLFSERLLVVADAVGLGIFSATGTQLALAAGLPNLPAVMMGVVTAVCGGLLRDVVCNELPMLLRDNRPYATCAFFGNWLLVGLLQTPLPMFETVVLCSSLIALARLLTLRWDVRLPNWKIR
jgi:uncharacterized membrane protein YeiH